MDLFKKKLKVVTHDGGFHTDEVFGCATLLLWADKNNLLLDIKRSRDPKVIDGADVVLDVGMVYDASKKRFDHHQKEGAGMRANGVPYASFGLIWKHYGENICGDKEVASLVEEKMVMPIDARDNGVNISKPTELGVGEYGFGQALHSFNLTWLEDKNREEDKQFFKALEFAKYVLEREVVVARAKIDGFKFTQKSITEQNNPEILVLDKYTDWNLAVSQNKNIKFVVYPHKNGRDWAVQTGRDDLEDYNSNRASLPETWWGLRDEALVEVSGVSDAIFCANRGWFGVAKTAQGALLLAQKALLPPFS